MLNDGFSSVKMDNCTPWAELKVSDLPWVMKQLKELKKLGVEVSTVAMRTRSTQGHYTRYEFAVIYQGHKLQGVLVQTLLGELRLGITKPHTPTISSNTIYLRTSSTADKTRFEDITLLADFAFGLFGH